MAKGEASRLEILGDEIVSTMTLPELLAYSDKLKKEIDIIKRETAIIKAETDWLTGKLSIPSRAMH